MSSGKIQGRKADKTILFFQEHPQPSHRMTQTGGAWVKPMSEETPRVPPLSSVPIILQQPSHFMLTVPMCLSHLGNFSCASGVGLQGKNSWLEPVGIK